MAGCAQGVLVATRHTFRSFNNQVPPPPPDNSSLITVRFGISMASTHASPPRVTELPNALTADIDIATSLGAVRLLGASDAGLFTGWGGLPGISSAEMISASGYLVRSIDRALRHPAGRVVISGCGTSGRLAHLISRGLNSWLERASIPFAGRFDYLIAGSDAALLLPQESAEDQFDSGRNDLEAWARATGVDADAPVVVIGVSCGLSATCKTLPLPNAHNSPR